MAIHLTRLQPVMHATRPGFLGKSEQRVVSIHPCTHAFAADCGPMGALCANLHPGTPSPLLFYTPATAAAPFIAAPVILAPFHSAACDFSTPVWVWAVLGTCLFLFFGAFDACVCVPAYFDFCRSNNTCLPTIRSHRAQRRCVAAPS